ncbi:hypothetical protein HA402_007341 [Bradysia odoriphaga]|nr:hypothetical protein HA402_007341 [Bradysia odoriphaga]
MQYAPTQLNQIKTTFATIMENAALQQKKFSKELRHETSVYVDEELNKWNTVADSEEIKSRIASCAEEIDDVIEAAITQFINILDTAERLVYGVEDKLRNEPRSDDTDEINDEVDDIFDECKENFEVVIIPRVNDLLDQLKKKFVTLRSDLQACIDEKTK